MLRDADQRLLPSGRLQSDLDVHGPLDRHGYWRPGNPVVPGRYVPRYQPDSASLAPLYGDKDLLSLFREHLRQFHSTGLPLGSSVRSVAITYVESRTAEHLVMNQFTGHIYRLAGRKYI
jgi:hypothetical protein